MIIEIPDDNSIVKWKYNDKDEWKVAEISDLIKAYDRPQGDLISRSALKKAIEQGEWIFLKANEEQTDGYECSVCKTTYHTRVPYFSEFNFCPNCGADMGGKQE